MSAPRPGPLLDALPVEQGAAIRQALSAGATYRDVARRLGISEREALSHLRAGLRTLHHQLAPRPGSEPPRGRTRTVVGSGSVWR